MWVAAPVFIDALLPAYESVVAPLRVYAVGMFFLCLSLGVSSTLVALDKHRYNIPIVVSAITANVALDLLFVKGLGWGLSAIAMGSALAYVSYWAAHMTLVQHYFGRSFTRSLRENLASGWPGFVLLGFTLLAAGRGVLSEQSVWFDSLLVAGVIAMTLVRWRHGHALALRGESPRQTARGTGP